MARAFPFCHAVINTSILKNSATLNVLAFKAKYSHLALVLNIIQS